MTKDAPIVTDLDVHAAAKLLGEGISVSDGDMKDFIWALAGGRATYTRVANQEDYIPSVDEERFPRVDIYRPDAEENVTNGWAYKFTLKDQRPASEASRPLEGKTLCVKDNVSVKGVPCLMGTNVIRDWVPNMDATIVTRILEAGGTILGKAVCENLSLYASSITAATGPIDNPYGKEYTCGGSSSGTAVLVSTGEVDLGIGGDQAGSIRMPSAFTGIVGLKPSFGLVPYTGIAGLESSIDHTGPMTKTVADAALLLKVIAGADSIDDRQAAGVPLPSQVPDYRKLLSEGAQGFKVGLVREGFNYSAADPRVSELVEKAARKLWGADVEWVDVPEHDSSQDLVDIIIGFGGVQSFQGREWGRTGHYMNDLSAKFNPWDQQHFDDLFCSAKVFMLTALDGIQHFPGLYGKAQNLRRKLRNAYNEKFGKYDILIMPTIPWVNKKKAPEIEASTLEKLRLLAGVVYNTGIFDLTGHPALSLPVGMLTPEGDDSVRLPVGMQIIGPWMRDDKVLRAAHAWETANDWKTFHEEVEKSTSRL